MSAPDNQLEAVRRELAELKAGQVEIAHSLANMRVGIDMIAAGVRELLREQGEKR